MADDRNPSTGSKDLAEDAGAYAPGRKLKLRKIGNSVGVALPKDLLTKLGAAGEASEQDFARWLEANVERV